MINLSYKLTGKLLCIKVSEELGIEYIITGLASTMQHVHVLAGVMFVKGKCMYFEIEEGTLGRQVFVMMK